MRRSTKALIQTYLDEAMEKIQAEVSLKERDYILLTWKVRLRGKVTGQTTMSVAMPKAVEKRLIRKKS